MEDTRLTLSEVKGPLNDLNEKLASQNGKMWLQDLNILLRNEHPWQKDKKRILEFQGSVEIPATKGEFIARKKFIVDTSDSAKVKIRSLGSNFEDKFLNKTEEPIGKTKLYYNRLKERAFNDLIIKKLGGEEKAETTLQELFSLMEMQDGKKGALLNDGCANIFYIRDINGVLRAVYVRWYDDGWRVYAISVEDPRRWHVGYLVFSR